MIDNSDLLAVDDSQNSEVTLLLGGPQKFYVIASGAYQGSWASAPDTPDFYDVPADFIEVPAGPDYADQLWLFPGWGPSRAAAAQIESAWQESEMAIIADQLLMIDDDDPLALPGTASQWKAYRIKVRAWKEGNTDFPDQTKRPVRPA